ncbi:uncharacterized protein LOC119986772 isoform X2 [Tripterygium wilfordii]|nr:uncharacterized protein LOC119986772 isoform X2 [Tripterygium wilfordii]
MHCSIQRALSDKQTVSHGEKSYSSRKFIEQDSFKGSSEVREVSALDCSSSDQRCALLMFLRLESNGHRRIVPQRMQCIDDTKQSRSEVNEDMNSMYLVTQPTTKSLKVDTPNVQIGPGFGVTQSNKSFTARSFSGPNWRHTSRNMATANKVCKSDDFSSYSNCRSSISCSDSCALTSEGSTTMSSSDVLIDSTKLDKVVKKTSKKKVRRRGKYKKKFPSDVESTEMEVLFEENAHGSSTLETCANNDLDHGDEVVLCTTSQEASAVDDRVVGTNFKATANKSARMLNHCNDEVDIVETAVPSISPHDPAIDCEIGIQTIAQGFSILDRGLEETTNVQISHDRDACLKEPDEGDGGITFPGPSGLSSEKKNFFHKKSGNGDVDTFDCDGQTNNSSQRFSSSGMQQVSSGKRGKQVKTFPSSCSVYKPVSVGNSNGCTGKENNHSIWQKVQKKDVDECRYESKKVSPIFLQSQFNITLKAASFPKKNCSAEEMSIRTKVKDKKPLKDKGSRRLKRKNSPGVKQEFHCYSGQGSHLNKASSNRRAKMSLQQNDMLAISSNANVQHRINSVLKSHSQSCSPRVELQSSTVESMNTETVHSLRVFPDALEPFENVHDIVSGMNVQNREDQDPTLPKSCLSLDASKLLEVRSPVFLPHLLANRVRQIDKGNSPENNKQNHSSSSKLLEVRSPVFLPHLLANRIPQIDEEISLEHNKQNHSSSSKLLEVQSPVFLPHLLASRVPQIDKENSLEHNKPNHSSGSILQKWIPIRKKDPVTAECEPSLVEHSHGAADEDWTFKSTAEKKAEPSSENLVSPQNAAVLMGGCCSSWEERNIRSLRHPVAGVFKGHDYNTIASKCPMSVSNDQNCSAFETVLDKIQQAVNDVCRVQVAAEAVHIATGGPIAELERLLRLSSPVIHQSPNLICCQSCSQDELVGAIPCRHETHNVSLGCLWQWYEKHGSYGLEVRAEDCESSKRFGVDRFAFRAYFVPFLSAVQLFTEHKRRPIKDNIKLQPSAVVETELGGKLENFSSFSHIPITSMLVPPSRTSKTGILALVDDMHHSQPSSVCAEEGSPGQSDDLECSNDLELLFEYFESEQPQQRRPLYEKIRELVRGDGPSQGSMYGDPTKLNSMNLHDLHPRSWFSVAWYPIYRIPDGNLRAAFLTYHSLGHLVRRSSQFDFSRDGCIASPVVGLQSYNVQGECWFQLRHSAMSPTAETSSLNPSGILKERLRTLEESASLFSRTLVNKGNQTGNNRHPDYEFFLSRRR